MENFILTNINTLKRFSNIEVEITKLENLTKIKQEMQEEKIILSSLRLDNVVSEICKTSRNKANEVIMQQRVFVNSENITKNTKMIKQDDKITIRGKGKYFVNQILNETKKGKIPVIISFYK